MRELVVQKALGIVLVGLAIAFLNPFQVALSFSVFGQGHFLGAYYYQWKAGKMKPKWIVAYFALTAALFAYALIVQRFELLALSAAIIFFIHHFQDEVTLFGKERSFYRGLELIPPIVVYSALTSDSLLGTSLTPSLSLVALLMWVIHACFVASGRYVPDVLSAYFFVITLGLVIVGRWFIQSIDPQVVIGSVILFHYVCWYVHFYFRFASKPERQRQYIWDMIGIHAIVFASYFLWRYSPLGFPFLYVFAPIFFYIWAILHIVFSIRISDYTALTRW